MKKDTNQKGFSPILVVLIFSAIFVVAGAGYWYSSEIKKATKEESIISEKPVPTVAEEQKPTEQSESTISEKTEEQPEIEEKISLENLRSLFGKCVDIMPDQVIEELRINPNRFQSEGELYAKKSKDDGWDIAIVPLMNYSVTGYCLLYPSDWTRRIAGAEGMNMIFNEKDMAGSKQYLFLQIARREGLSLEKADQVAYGFEGFPPAPIVDQSENIITKQIQDIGGAQVLYRLSEKGGLVITRYFRVSGDTIYMFRASASKDLFDGPEYTQFLTNLRKMVESMKFVR